MENFRILSNHLWQHDWLELDVNGWMCSLVLVRWRLNTITIPINRFLLSIIILGSSKLSMDGKGTESFKLSLLDVTGCRLLTITNSIAILKMSIEDCSMFLKVSQVRW